MGPTALHADHKQEWFGAGSADCFWAITRRFRGRVDTFVEEVVPLLRQRGVYPTGYVGNTLRENLGVPDQYGLDTRVSTG